MSLRLEFDSFDGRTRASVGHGQECVGITLSEIYMGRRTQGIGGIVLTPDEAHALGVRLIQQARVSRKPER